MLKGWNQNDQARIWGSNAGKVRDQGARISHVLQYVERGYHIGPNRQTVGKIPTRQPLQPADAPTVQQRTSLGRRFVTEKTVLRDAALGPQIRQEPAAAASPVEDEPTPMQRAILLEPPCDESMSDFEPPIVLIEICELLIMTTIHAMTLRRKPCSNGSAIDGATTRLLTEAAPQGASPPTAWAGTGQHSPIAGRHAHHG